MVATIWRDDSAPVAHMEYCSGVKGLKRKLKLDPGGLEIVKYLCGYNVQIMQWHSRRVHYFFFYQCPSEKHISQNLNLHHNRVVQMRTIYVFVKII